MTEYSTAVEMPGELGPLDVLLYRAESIPGNRAGMVSLETLEGVPDWNRFRDCFDQASRLVPRLRQKVVMPSLPTAPPQWVVDPDFDLDFHVHRTRLDGEGSLREAMDIAEEIANSPTDVTRPLWQVTLIEGLAGGRSAIVQKMSHAVTDGMGGADLLRNIYDDEPDPAPRPRALLPIPADVAPDELMRAGLRRLPKTLIAGVRQALNIGIGSLGKLISAPASTIGTTIGEARGYTESVGRVMRAGGEHSPLLAQRGGPSRTEAVEVPFADLRRAAKAVGGSLNDIYLAGLCAALRRYHDRLGAPVDTLPLAVPVSLRSDDDDTGGNRFTGVTFAAPISEKDPATLIATIHDRMLQGRDEPAIGLVSAIAPVFSILPAVLFDALSQSFTPADVQASNVAMYPQETYIAGVKVLRQYGLGPLPGTAVMALMISRGGICTISARYDCDAITDTTLFARCLRDGFDEMLAVGGTGARCVTSTFGEDKLDGQGAS